MTRTPAKYGSEGHRALVALGLSGAELAGLAGVAGSVARSWLAGARVPRGGARRVLEKLYPQVQASAWDRPDAVKTLKPSPSKPAASKTSLPTSAAVAIAAAQGPDLIVGELEDLLGTLRDARRGHLSAGELARVAGAEAQILGRLAVVREAARAREAAAPASDDAARADFFMVRLRVVFCALDSWKPEAGHPATAARHALHRVGETSEALAARMARFDDLDSKRLAELHTLTTDPALVAEIRRRSA